MKVNEKVKTILRIAFIVVVLGTIGMFWLDEVTDFLAEDKDLSETYTESGNVAVIKVYGYIVSYEEYEEDGWVQTSSDTVVDYIDKIDAEDEMKAIVVEIDSYGGSPIAGEEICNALKRTEKPTVALIKEGGASAAYMIAVGTDRVFASRLSEVGSIGVTMSYLDYTKMNEEEGIFYQQLSSGKYKDAGNANKELTDEERELLMRDVKIVHQIFIEMVAEHRGLEIETVEELADGSTMMGDAAKEAGLIDEIGDMEAVKQYLRDEFDMEPVLYVYGE
jgi:protease-4